jgi:hypothetical protein
MKKTSAKILRINTYLVASKLREASTMMKMITGRLLQARTGRSI